MPSPQSPVNKKKKIIIIKIHTFFTILLYKVSEKKLRPTNKTPSNAKQRQTTNTEQQPFFPIFNFVNFSKNKIKTLCYNLKINKLILFLDIIDYL